MPNRPLRLLEDSMNRFVFEVVSEGARRVMSVGEKGRQARPRQGSGRSYDPYVLQADRFTEEVLLERLSSRGLRAVVLSEEAGRVEMGLRGTEAGPQRGEADPRGMAVGPRGVAVGPRGRETGREGAGTDGKPEWYFVCDPLDGSSLYQRDLRAGWYVALAAIDADGRPRSTVMLDILNAVCYLADPTGSYRFPVTPGDFQPVEGQAEPLRVREPGRVPGLTLATYLMKPLYLFSAVERVEGLLRRADFIFPQGGPCGFAYVADNKVDAYLALNESLTEVYTGIDLALQAGAVVTDLQGNPPRFVPDVEHHYDLLCSRSRELHERLLTQLQQQRRD